MHTDRAMAVIPLSACHAAGLSEQLLTVWLPPSSDTMCEGPESWSGLLQAFLEAHQCVFCEVLPCQGRASERCGNIVSMRCAGVAWSSEDPWSFASLSYDGRVAVHKVPSQVKYKILI